jgi:hypothetical protein
MLPIEILRRWGVPLCGVALLIVGVVLLVQGNAVPADSAAYTTPREGGTSPQTWVMLGWIMAPLGVVLTAGWIIALRVRSIRRPPAPDAPQA